MRSFQHSYGLPRSERVGEVVQRLGEAPGCRGQVRRLYVRESGRWRSVGWRCDGCGRAAFGI